MHRSLYGSMKFYTFRKTELTANDEKLGDHYKNSRFTPTLEKNQNLVIPSPYPPWPQAAETAALHPFRLASFPAPTCLL